MAFRHFMFSSKLSTSILFKMGTWMGRNILQIRSREVNALMLHLLHYIADNRSYLKFLWVQVLCNTREYLQTSNKNRTWEGFRNVVIPRKQGFNFLANSFFHLQLFFTLLGQLSIRNNLKFLKGMGCSFHEPSLALRSACSLPYTL